MEEQFVIKTSSGSYAGPHSNGKEMNLYATSLDYAPKFTKKEIQNLRVNFRSQWERNDFEIHQVIFDSKRVYF